MIIRESKDFRLLIKKGAHGLKFGQVEIWVFFEENGKSAFSVFCELWPAQAASPFEYSVSSFFL